MDADDLHFDPPTEHLAIMLQTHIAFYGPVPDELKPDIEAMFDGDGRALIRVAKALAIREGLGIVE